MFSYTIQIEFTLIMDTNSKSKIRAMLIFVLLRVQNVKYFRIFRLFFLILSASVYADFMVFWCIYSPGNSIMCLTNVKNCTPF